MLLLFIHLYGEDVSQSVCECVCSLVVLSLNVAPFHSNHQGADWQNTRLGYCALADVSLGATPHQHTKCSVVGCVKQQENLFTVPASADTSVRDQRIRFAGLCVGTTSLQTGLPTFGSTKLKTLIPSIRDPVQSVSSAALCDMLCAGLSNRTEVAADMLTLA